MAGPDDPDGPVEPVASAPERSADDRIDLLIIGAVLALLLVWVPALGLALLTPRMAIALVLAGPGLVVVGGLVRRRDAGARWIAAFLAWALLAALLAPHPRFALIGSYGTDTGWIWLACFVGAWGIGRRLGVTGRRLLPGALVLGISVNAAFGFLEAAFEPDGQLSPADGRVLGLVSNSLFLAGLLCGGLALLGRLSATAAPRRWGVLALIVLTAGAVNLTGSRAALAGGALVAVAGAFAAWWSAGERWVKAGLGAALVAGAVLVGVLVSGPLQGQTSSTSRIGDVSTSSGYSSRTMMWGFGLDAVAERPVFGWGPGRFREATGPRTTAAFVRAEGPEKLFYDAHNLFVEHLVTEGVVGLILLLGFIATAIRRCRGPLAWFALGVALTWMLNPVSACTGPVALIALGAAWRRGPPGAPNPDGDAVPEGAVSDPAERRTVGRIVGAVLLVVGLLAAANLVVIDALVEQGTANAELGPLQDAQRLLPGDATITGTVTDAYAIQAQSGSPEAGADVIASARRATREDPTRSIWWVRRGYAEVQYLKGTDEERVAAAVANFRKALELSPWSSAALTGMYRAGEELDDQAEMDRWGAKLCQIGRCPEDP